MKLSHVCCCDHMRPFIFVFFFFNERCSECKLRIKVSSGYGLKVTSFPVLFITRSSLGLRLFGACERRYRPALWVSLPEREPWVGGLQRPRWWREVGTGFALRATFEDVSLSRVRGTQGDGICEACGREHCPSPLRDLSWFLCSSFERCRRTNCSPCSWRA